MTPLTFFDAVRETCIPRNAQALAGYIDGRWPNLSAMRQLVPEALWLSVATRSSSNAMVLDVEAGDATPATAAQWAVDQLRQSVARPCFYLSLSAVPGLERALSRAGVARSSVRVWTAHWTGVPHICDHNCGVPMLEGPGATQYLTDHAGGFDRSLTSLEWFRAVRSSYLNREKRT